MSSILKQIEADGGVVGSRARKNARRAADTNPVKERPEYTEEAVVAEDVLDPDQDFLHSFFSRSAE